MKKIEDIQRIAVVGAGVMGAGIALAAAVKGYQVVLFDIKPDVLEKARAYFDKFLSSSVKRGKITAEQKPEIIAAIHCTEDLAAVKADIVIEAILENLVLKQKVLRNIEAQNSGDTIIASNTSTIPITQIAAGLDRPEMVVGMHFFNPAPIMKLVEVISGVATAPEVGDVTFALAEKLGKKPVRVKDEPGFIVNRVARHFYVESLKVLEEGVADHVVIDRLMESSGFRMGPFRLMDLIGIETNHEVTKSLYNSFFQDEKFRPSRVQQKKVDAGHFGRKTGQGFYQY
ncbi:MAG TPA: 3-hydroxybutyryl-CoA dehydrogenase [Bacteroidetes bacterium]|nr:3-hydroxybutyryl-CoA dehydrogenase [Bacteroidota bacterium]